MFRYGVSHKRRIAMLTTNLTGFLRVRSFTARLSLNSPPASSVPPDTSLTRALPPNPNPTTINTPPTVSPSLPSASLPSTSSSSANPPNGSSTRSAMTGKKLSLRRRPRSQTSTLSARSCSARRAKTARARRVSVAAMPYSMSSMSSRVVREPGARSRSSAGRRMMRHNTCVQSLSASEPREWGILLTISSLA